MVIFRTSDQAIWANFAKIRSRATPATTGTMVDVLMTVLDKKDKEWRVLNIIFCICLHIILQTQQGNR